MQLQTSIVLIEHIPAELLTSRLVSQYHLLMIKNLTIRFASYERIPAATKTCLRSHTWSYLKCKDPW